MSNSTFIPQLFNPEYCSCFSYLHHLFSKIIQSLPPRSTSESDRNLHQTKVLKSLKHSHDFFERPSFLFSEVIRILNFQNLQNHILALQLLNKIVSPVFSHLCAHILKLSRASVILILKIKGPRLINNSWNQIHFLSSTGHSPLRTFQSGRPFTPHMSKHGETHTSGHRLLFRSREVSKGSRHQNRDGKYI